MKLVKEHISFQRNIEPKKSMGTGFDIIKKLWDFQAERGIGSIGIGKSDWGKTRYLEVVDTMCDSDLFNKTLEKHFPEEFFYKHKWEHKRKGSWLRTNYLFINPQYFDLFDNAFDEMGLIKPLKESNFERNVDPKKSMGTGLEEEIKEWIDKRADGHYRDRLLFCAIDNKKLYVDYILAHMTKDDKKNMYLAIDWAADAGHLDIIKKLVKAGANPNSHTEGIYWAAGNNHTSVVKYLLSFDCSNINWDSLIQRLLNVNKSWKDRYTLYNIIELIRQKRVEYI